MVEIRKIQQLDNKYIAFVIRNVMTEFRADPETTVLGDTTLKTMYENYKVNKAVYYIAEVEGKIIGGCGIKQLAGSDESVCELQRMFILPEGRGKKIGKQLLELCITKAKEFGYEKIYLESLVQMKAARALYEQYGFKEINHPLGSTGHEGCDIWMIKEL